MFLSMLDKTVGEGVAAAERARKRKGLILRFGVASVALLLPAAHEVTAFDLARDFSFKKGDQQMWQYGYSATNSLEPSEFRKDKFADSNGPVGFWHPDVSKGPGPGWYPYVAYNTTSHSQIGSNNGWSVRPGEVAMEGSTTGQYSLVRFLAPEAAKYHVTAKFEGVHFGLSTTDVHILLNNTSLFAADINGYGGDPAFHAVQGASPSAEYSGDISLKANDTVTFAVGYGRNKTNSCDTTGLFVQVHRISRGE
jgi:hypothetical protein